ncbi:hypothetical protein BLA29_009468 [Euroglyphus maynei]|uniref:Uncharacterized protein n=1 Tax=Euroglyphus maynei TaxID=6958 RepID=A0A1Y3BEI7_EURMA|nr:hypothetical protein BLA29_009468 [Euroglyphus maynei]
MFWAAQMRAKITESHDIHLLLCTSRPFDDGVGNDGGCINDDHEWIVGGRCGWGFRRRSFLGLKRIWQNGWLLGRGCVGRGTQPMITAAIVVIVM